MLVIFHSRITTAGFKVLFEGKCCSGREWESTTPWSKDVEIKAQDCLPQAASHSDHHLSIAGLLRPWLFRIITINLQSSALSGTMSV
jgi:hypothetical protein